MALDSGKRKEQEPAFYPKSVAVAGVFAGERKMENRYHESPLAAGFKGKLYPVNPQGGQIEGLPIYPSVKAIPEPVDYGIVAIRKQFILDLLGPWVAADVRSSLHITHTTLSPNRPRHIVGHVESRITSTELSVHN